MGRSGLENGVYMVGEQKLLILRNYIETGFYFKVGTEIGNLDYDFGDFILYFDGWILAFVWKYEKFQDKKWKY